MESKVKKTSFLKRRVKVSKLVNIIVNTIEWAIFATLLVVFVVVLSPLLPTKKYIYTYVVASGSMEPTIYTGSVAFVKPITADQVKLGDIITFTDPNNPKETVIHRAVDIKQSPTGPFISTKGDNNNVADSWQVTPSLIKGRYLYSIPYLGYAALSIRTKIGFAVFVGIPAILLLLLQFKKIKEGIEEEIQRRTNQAMQELGLDHKASSKTHLSLIFTTALLGSLILLGSSRLLNAVFSSTVTVSGITLTTASSFDKTPDVVINEVMWMGSTVSIADEWIELRNTTDHDIDLSNWQIDNAVGGNGHLEIPANHTIPAHGYFLIANYDADNSHSALSVQADLVSVDLSLNNNYQTNGALVLHDKDKKVIDQTPTPNSTSWPQGNLDTTTGLHQSMERNDTPGDGSDPNNWHTCTDIQCTSTNYWDAVGQNYGTPKAANHSGGSQPNNNSEIENPQEDKETTGPATPDVTPTPDSSPSADLSNQDSTPSGNLN